MAVAPQNADFRWLRQHRILLVSLLASVPPAAATGIQ